MAPQFVKKEKLHINLFRLSDCFKRNRHLWCFKFPFHLEAIRLSILIPAYNESEHIEQMWSRLQEVELGSICTEWEYVFINDCSTDSTREVILKLIESRKDARLLDHEQNKGKGAAILTGVQAAKYDLIIIQDADLELLPIDILLMLETMLKYNLDFVNGSRYMPGLIRPLYSYRRYFANQLFTRLASVLINVRLTDLACGYKLFRRQMYLDIDLKEERFGIDAELLIKAALRAKTSIAEVPVHYFPRNKGEGKKMTNWDGLRILKTIIKYGLFRRRKG